MKSIARNIRISPKKLAVIAAIVRGMDVQKALDTLRFMPTKGSALLYKVVASALANAVQNDSQEAESLKIATVVIGKGITYRRGNPISRGRSHPILKRTSVVTLELGLK